MYSLIKNSWKEIEVNLKFGTPVESYSPVFVKGSIYWTVRKRTLLSFNVQSEDFCTISLPPDTACDSCQETRCDDLFEFKGSVAFIHDCQIINIWTLDDHGCWIKKLAINSETIRVIVGCLKTGEILGCNFRNKLVLYDSVNEVAKSIQRNMHTHRTYNYSESLVDLDIL